MIKTRVGLTVFLILMTSILTSRAPPMADQLGHDWLEQSHEEQLAASVKPADGNATDTGATAQPQGANYAAEAHQDIDLGYSEGDEVALTGRVEAFHGGHNMSFAFNLRVKIDQGAGNGYVSEYGVVTLFLNLLKDSKVRMEIRGFLRKPNSFDNFCSQTIQTDLAHLVRGLKFSLDGNPDFNLAGELRKV